MFALIKVLYLVFVCVMRSSDVLSADLKLPKDFLIGVATSAYQTEGAWNVPDKSESIWDRYVRKQSSKTADSSTGDVACDSYHKYKEDIELLHQIKVDHYRFSISWPRILPKGSTRYVSHEGIRHYHRVLDELESRNITPFVTIYHWDHPQILEEFGGWQSEKNWLIYSLITPGNSYRFAIYAPGANLSGTGEYLCVHNMLKAHALTYHMYNKEFRSEQKGQIGLVNACPNFYSKSRNDSTSNDIAFEFDCGWVASAIFSKQGDYPSVMKDRIALRSRLQGYNSSWLPVFSTEWVDLIKNTADYFGLNHYTSQLVEPAKPSPLDWFSHEGLTHSVEPKWPSTQSDWLKVNPKGIRDLLITIKKKYNNPPVYILENGVSYGHGIDDDFRINYLKSYMNETVLAMKRYNCRVKAYTIWTMLDDFESDSGYTEQFGIVDIIFKDENRKRSLKKSAIWLKDVLESRRLS